MADGDSSLSAWAPIFMFGTAYRHESDSVNHRGLHVGGTLGFHQPDLPPDPNRSYSAGDVRKAYEAAIEAPLQLLVLAARPRPFREPDLLEAMLRRKGQDFFQVDEVGKAGCRGIGLTGFGAPQLTEEALLYACQNLTTRTARLAVDQVGIEAKNDAAFFNRAAWPEIRLESNRIDIEFAGMQTRSCAIGIARHWSCR